MLLDAGHSTDSGGAFIIEKPALDDQYRMSDTWLTYGIQILTDGDYAICLFAREYTGKSDSFFAETNLEALRGSDLITNPSCYL